MVMFMDRVYHFGDVNEKVYFSDVNSLTAKSILAGEKLVYVGIVHNILHETKTWHTKIYLPTQRTNWRILYDIN